VVLTFSKLRDIYFGKHPHNETSSERAASGTADHARAHVDAGEFYCSTNRAAP
jgi:hypothetical protein